MGKSKATHYFEAILYETGDASYAARFAAQAVAFELAEAFESGASSSTLEEEWGVKKGKLSSDIVHEWRTQIVDDPNSILDIPDSKCIDKHLPKGRRPTPAEIRKALQACK
jgi:hypothetical protein